MKAVLVTTKHRGVFFGFILAAHELEETLVLERCRCAIRWHSSVRGFLGLAKTGPSANCMVGAEAPRVVLHDVTSVTDCTEEAIAAWTRA